MLKNYFLSAWRHILKNKLYATINILGLVIGLSVYIFGSLLATYERSHDLFYENSGRIYTVGSLFSPTAEVGVGEMDATFSAVGPFIEADVPEVEAVARSVGREYLLTIDEDSYYQSIRFADPDFTTIFDFHYIEGDSRALDDPTGMIVTSTAARKFFGDGPALGRTLTLDHKVTLRVTAVVEDLPRNTHFNSSIVASVDFAVVAPLKALEAASGYDIAGDWDNLSTGHLTYVLLPGDKTQSWLQSKLDGIYSSHFPEAEKELVIGMRVRPLEEINTIIWDMVGMPMIATVQLLGLLVLVVAIVNYTNLATAQSLGRAREVGLRKTMGAVKTQLLQQFLVESVTIAAIAMLIALALLEICVPLFNSSVDRALTIDYSATLPWLILTTLGVGLVAGAYPAHLITRAKPIDALRDGSAKGVKGGLFRNIMLGLQFTISIFMLAMVLVVYFQNVKIENSSNIFPRSQILVLDRLGVETIRTRLDTLRNEISRIPGVENIAFSSQVPYEQNTSQIKGGTEAGDEASAFNLQRVIVDEHFMEAYDIPLLAGRNLNVNIADDIRKEEVLSLNVIINELAAEKVNIPRPSRGLYV
jgi:putative ABC transport system permease protein|tara:strand:+ start:29061 stop:30824 length:1764 start_codon:yes stop_codon:yes gene_type:complete